MSARDVLGIALAAGFRLESKGEKLHVEPTPPPDLVEQLPQHKDEVLELLSAPGAPMPEPGQTPWVDRPDVVMVIEDLSDEGQGPARISRGMGLSQAEVIAILRRTGR